MKRLIRPSWYRANGAVIGYIILTAAVTVALVGVVFLAVEGLKSHDAVCALRADLVRRVADGEEFLDKHPNGLPKAGISRADLERSINGYRDTIKALGVADC